MKRIHVLMLFILINAASGDASHAQTSESYLIPRIVYVGDPAVLVLSLPAQGAAQSASSDSADIILTPDSPNFPFDADIDFHRVILERRASGSRLLVEFTAFVPGVLELPVIDIGGQRIADLNVAISSIIDPGRSGRELSGPAHSLSIPGTALMIYAAMAAFVLLLVITFWFLFKGRRYLNSWIARWKRWNLFISMKIREKNLYRALLKGGDSRVILDRLSLEFRSFLSLFTGSNCRAMTAYELERLVTEIDCVFLGRFFRRCDELRFSGGSVDTENVSQLLADLRLFLVNTEKAEREKNQPKGEMAA